MIAARRDLETKRPLLMPDEVMNNREGELLVKMGLSLSS